MGKKFHPQCFVCAHCRKPFPGGSFFVHKDKPYCKSDYESLCARCDKVIDGILVNYKDEKYHTQCFRCHLCGKSLADKDYFELEGHPYCKEDYELEKRLKGKGSSSAPAPAPSSRTAAPTSSSGGNRCETCREAIDGQSVRYEGKLYHEWCFKCSECKMMLAKGEDFFEGKRGVLCRSCHDYQCQECQQVIKTSEAIVKFKGAKYHGNCFRCTKCRTVLDPKEFYELSGKPYCHSDYKQTK